ncbi:hypothetical protein ACIRG5_14980 [Lentzea sp. NPDC102401]
MEKLPAELLAAATLTGERSPAKALDRAESLGVELPRRDVSERP